MMNNGQFNNIFWKNLDSTKRYLIHQGGTSSGKTYANLQYCTLLGYRHKKGKKEKIISVVSETMPHLKKGAIRDFLNIIKDFNLFQPSRWNKSEYSYRFDNAVLEFFSADNQSKVRGPRRDVLFINECNSVPYETYDQLAIRTREKIILDYNPVSSFWVHEKIIPYKDHDYIHSTYKDNDFLEDEIKKDIESRRQMDPNWWRVYGLGEVGSLEGLIYNNWDQVDAIPKDAQLVGYGLDFGYTNDSTALIAVYKMDNDIYADELIYSTGLTNPDIAAKLSELNLGKNEEIFADNSEPKSIAEIYSSGWNIKPVVKGADSIMFGIDIIKQRKLYVTKRSLNLVKELRNYSYSKDKDGNQVNKPIDSWNHALDALRYLCMMRLSKRTDGASRPRIAYI